MLIYLILLFLLSVVLVLRFWVLVRINVMVQARVVVWVQFKVGVRARIAFFCLHASVQISSIFFQMIEFYSLLDGNKARTKVLLLAIPRAQPINQSVDISVSRTYVNRYCLSAITLNCLFCRASSSTLALYLQSMTCVCNSLSFVQGGLCVKLLVSC